MSKLFKNTVDVENGIVYKLNKKEKIGSLTKDGYLKCIK